MDQDVKKYFMNLRKTEKNEVLDTMKQFALENKVPIIQDEGLDFVVQILKIKKPLKILEIGTAIGFSSINFSLALPNCQIDTIERDEKMYEEAKKNIAKVNLEDRINLIRADAMDFDISNLESDYDVIFIDAAKSQYRRFFLKYEQLLKNDGLIITDNLLFHGLVFAKIENRNLRQLVRKIKEYTEWLFEYDKYDTNIFSIGDGIAISIKK